MSRLRLRLRRSTVLLAAVFVGTLLLYLEVRPPPPARVRYPTTSTAPMSSSTPLLTGRRG
jgi:hypothetical protein